MLSGRTAFLCLLGLSATTLLILANLPFRLSDSFYGETRASPPAIITSKKTGIVVVSDAEFQKFQEPLYETHRAYAKRHGYEYAVLDPAEEPACNIPNFFFNKHCVVRVYLARKPPGYTLFVFDGDVINVALNVTLDRWIQEEADVLLYERDWNYEITAGNYMVRNTKFGLYFLDVWMQFFHRSILIRGFNSADNGAIHLATLQVLNFPANDFRECHQRYQELASPVTNLTEYYQFVGCTRRVLGPNRRWIVNGIVDGALTILHRYHGFAVDYYIANRKGGGAVPFYHGEKDPEEAIKHYAQTKPWASAAQQGQAIAALDAWWSCAVNCSQPWNSVPRVRLESCVSDFSCLPAPMDGMPLPDAYRRSSMVLFDYSSLYGANN